VKPEEGRSLARALGRHWVVMMRRHGATVAGTSLRDCVFRTVYSCRNAEYQLQAEGLGTIGPLSAGEIKGAGAIHHQPGPLNRAWEYWVRRVEKKGEAPPPAARPARAGARRGGAKVAARRSKSVTRGAKKMATKGRRR
jgi:HCOMODA/2-hydroxy-3-carboxy-muconic semialdehyde decarboxylase